MGDTNMFIKLTELAIASCDLSSFSIIDALIFSLILETGSLENLKDGWDSLDIVWTAFWTSDSFTESIFDVWIRREISKVGFALCLKTVNLNTRDIVYGSFLLACGRYTYYDLKYYSCSVLKYCDKIGEKKRQ